MTFNAAAVNALIDGVASIAMDTGAFRSVNTHEPKSAPGSGLRLAIWAQTVEPIAAASGLASTSGYVVLQARAYGNMLQKPEDEIDPRLMTAATVLIGAFSADFTLGGLVRNVDLPVRAEQVDVTIGGTMYRIFTVTVPCVVNDMWEQVSDL